MKINNNIHGTVCSLRNSHLTDCKDMLVLRNDPHLSKFLKNNEDIYKESKDMIIRNLCILLFPMAPHIASEVYENYFNEDLIKISWPEVDTENLKDPTYELVIQINGTLFY